MNVHRSYTNKFLLLNLEYPLFREIPEEISKKTWTLDHDQLPNDENTSGQDFKLENVAQMKLVNLTDLVADVDLHVQSSLLQNEEIILD